MKNYTSISEWLKTKPTENEMNKVLELINKGVKRELRTELYHKQVELKKALKLSTSMNELGFKETEEMVKKVKSLNEEIKSLKDQIGVVPQRTKKSPQKEVIPEIPETSPIEEEK